MTNLDAAATAMFAFRAALGTIFVAHGYNHILGGGRIQGTARWFESLGMRPGLSAVIVAGLIAIAIGSLARRQIGGQTGDVLGTIEQGAETAALLAAAAYA